MLPDEIEIIARNASHKINLPIEEGGLDVIKRYATNGREAVNIVQIAAGLAITEGRSMISTTDIEWVINSGQYSPRPEKKVAASPQIGLVNGLAVYGPNMGALLELEAGAIPAAKGKGQLTITGVVDEEEIGGHGRIIRRKSMARASIENVLTVLRQTTDVDPMDYDIHINFPGGVPIDGPSAGVAVAAAVYSAIKKVPVDNLVAMTGEISIRGVVMPVGGIVAKVEAARLAGAKKVLVPRENYIKTLSTTTGIEIIPVDRLDEVLAHALLSCNDEETAGITPLKTDIFAAHGVVSPSMKSQ